MMKLPDGDPVRNPEGLPLVYFIGCAKARSIKVGFTTGDPAKRLKALQTGCPRDLHLVSAAVAEQRHERMLHEAFGPLRLTGEWFRWTGPVEHLAWYFSAQRTDGAYLGHVDHDTFLAGVWDAIITGDSYPWTDSDAYRAMYHPSVWASEFAELAA